MCDREKRKLLCWIQWSILWTFQSQKRFRNEKVRASLASIHEPNGHTRLEDLVGAMLASLPRSSLLNIQKKIVPLLQLDVVAVSSSSKYHLPTL